MAELHADRAGTLLAPERLARRRPPRGDQVDLRRLRAELRRSVEGEVRFDRGSLGLYAEDASNYRQVPLGVVIPRTEEDVVATVAACRSVGAPIVARGGGTALAGQTCNRALVIDFSKYLHHVLDVDPATRTARVQPGTICDHLVREAEPHRLTFGPKPATHDHCTFGGMLANDCGGIYAQMNGTARNNVEELDALLYDGTRVHLGWTDDARMDEIIGRGGRIGQLHAAMRALRDRYADRIRERFPQIPRRVSGYNLDQLLPGPDGRFNLARVLVGSEGTLATILEAKVTLIPSRPERVLVVIGFEDVYQAGDAVPALLEHEPVGLEGLDDRLLHGIRRKRGPHARYLDLLPEGRGFLFVEVGCDDKREAIELAHALAQRARRDLPVVDLRVIADEAEAEKLWAIRESGLGATAFIPGEPDAWPGWEDSAVPPARVGAYLRDLRGLLERYGYHAALYGHFGQGCVHCRIDFDLTSAEGIARYRSFVGDAADLVLAHGGSLSGEHGDGQARAELLSKMFGDDLVLAFRELKAVWDPDGKMNPGKVVDPNPIVADLRLGAGYDPWQPPTHFRYPEDDGSFAHATLRCVGIGKCRRTSGHGADDTMCPSFMVTREEKHTTRGRAHLLWEMLQGGPVEDGWRSREVKESLDLCLSCKGCKGDCPVNVDIATYKSEFMSHYYERRLRPRHAYAFGFIDKWARLASLAPGLVNLATQSPGISWMAKLAAGMPHSRRIPAFAPETFRRWFARRSRRAADRQVVLWADTFNNHFFPDTARAAVSVLEDAGFEVIVPRGHLCCGRPLYDFGMLDTARRYLERVLAAMAPHLEARTPIVVLEPSCAAVFRDELPNLMPDREDAKRLVAQTKLLSELLHDVGYEPPLLHRKAIVQGHCHHKAIMRFDDESALLRAMELDAALLPSGCCGMAGSFGFEAEKVDVSQAAGERVLLPAVRSAADSTLILADGFSCREQIAQGSERHALHLAEAMALALAHGAGGPRRGSPEAAIVVRRRRAVRRSMLRAGALLALAAGLGLALAWRRRR